MPNNSKRLPMPDASAYLERMRAGQLTASALLEQQLGQLQLSQPKLNACTTILDEIARRQAFERRPGPLCGLPVTVKETFALAGTSITAGSLRMRPQQQGSDAAVVRRLRDAGAIIVARSNIPEFAMTGETSNPRFGRTNNPLDPERVAGGSTGGEGALVASGASLIGLGSDILGSIRIPAAFCGVVGFKPASGAVDKQGTWPSVAGYSANWLAVGPLARSVRDARLVYEVIAREPLRAPAPLEGLRLLVPDRFPYSVEQPCIQEALSAALSFLVEAGLRPETPAFDDVPRMFVRSADVILYDFEQDWHTLLSPDGAPKFSVWREAWHQVTGRPGIDPGLFTWILHGATLGRLSKPRDVRQMTRLAAFFDSARNHYRAMLGEDGILVLPTIGMLAPKHGQMNRKTLRPGLNKLMTPLTFCNYLDLPAMAIPAWRFADPATGLPPSVMIVCAPGAESRLFDVAAALEPELN
ncbi:amidase [Massilia endophytica]|uniref:amidase n=1 Tax=Massilia endophytica TaxID=2899220 RepID=UPI001E3C095F|nr:amidase [Massilia endophytica]UGQ45320.1 amidase [Massilia endophytica]